MADRASEHTFMLAEERRGGQVSLGDYLRYLKLMPRPALCWPPVIALIVLANALPSAFKWYVGQWIGNGQADLVFFHIFVLAVIGLRALNWFVTSFYLSVGGLKLHNDMAKSFAQVPVTFFDQQPAGRLVRRFSGDYAQAHTEIPNYMTDTICGSVELMWVLGMVFFQAHWLLLACLPCAVFYLWVQRLYKPASRELQRLSKVLESPIWSLFSEALAGMQTIKLSNRSAAFLKALNEAFTPYVLCSLVQARCTRWLNIQLKFASEFLALSLGFYAAWGCAFSGMGVGQAGFLMSLSLGLDMAMQWLTRSVTLLETSMVSVERMMDYRHLPPEPGLGQGVGQGLLLPKILAPSGDLIFKDVVARYAPSSPVVLQGLSFTVPWGTHVGIIGRTGSGKSSIFQLLFRMMYLDSGLVTWNGVSLWDAPVEQVRALFGIIPQQPTLFKGTLRSNLDRSQALSDELLWQALDVAQLGDFVRSLPQALNTPVVEGGVNFSVGQRQLLCMARALLVNAPLILLDEATASVDSKTDEALHLSLKNAAAGKTALIIAHRLQTVRDCHMVVVVGDGRIETCGKPEDVLPQRHRSLEQLEIVP